MPTQSVKTKCTITMQVPTGMRSPLRHFERPEEGTQAHHHGAVRFIVAVRVGRSRSGAKPVYGRAWCCAAMAAVCGLVGTSGGVLPVALSDAPIDHYLRNIGGVDKS